MNSALKISAAWLVVSLFAVAGCEEPAATAESVQEIPRNVRVLELSRETMSEYFEISGPIAPVRGADLSAEESGPVVNLAVAKGSAVLSGQMLIEQDRRILKAEMEASASALAAQAYNVDKVRQLHDAGKVSRIEMLNAETDFAQTEAMATIAAERYERAGIRAPFDGVLVDRFVELGQLVAPGMPVARVIDPYTLKLEAYLTDQQIHWVNEGDLATVIMGEATDTAGGVVSWVGFEADRLTGKFKVEIEIANPDLKLRSGVIGRARLGKNVVRDVVVIPRDAVLKGRVGPTAFVVEGERAVLRQLTLGAAQGMMVVVTEGLDMGDRLVVRGHRELREDSLVRVAENASAADGSVASDPAEVTRSEVGSRVPEVATTNNDNGVEANQ